MKKSVLLHFPCAWPLDARGSVCYAERQICLVAQGPIRAGCTASSSRRAAWDARGASMGDPRRRSRREIRPEKPEPSNHGFTLRKFRENEELTQDELSNRMNVAH